MTTPHRSKPDDDDTLSARSAARLLLLGLDEPVRPVDQLLDRLSRPNGAEWFAGLVRDWNLAPAGPVAELGLPDVLIAEGQATLDQLMRIKQRCSTLLAQSQDDASRLRATAGYFMSIAAGLAHHQQLISSRSPKDLLPVLSDLAAVTPQPWSNLFLRAVRSLAAAAK